MTLKVRRLNRHNASLHAHVLIWRSFGLCAKAESAHPLQQLPLSRGQIGREPNLASWLVEIPNRDRERSSSLFRNADDSHVKIGEKALAFLLRHCQRHRTLPSAPRSAARVTSPSRRSFCRLGRGRAVPPTVPPAPAPTAGWSGRGPWPS